MRMLRPSPGEAADRQTILELKIKYGAVKKINILPFQNENNELQTYMDLHYFQKIDDRTGAEYTKQMRLLYAVNNALWRVEDEVRLRAEHPEIDRDRLAEIALLVPKLNDERSDLVQSINKLFNIAEQEKIYLAKNA